jgi:hypothetical protein
MNILVLCAMRADVSTNEVCADVVKFPYLHPAVTGTVTVRVGRRKQEENSPAPMRLDTSHY